jgi:hypothetical protein
MVVSRITMQEFGQINKLKFWQKYLVSLIDLELRLESKLRTLGAKPLLIRLGVDEE